MMTKQPHQRSMSTRKSVPLFLAGQMAACAEWLRVASSQRIAPPDTQLSILPVQSGRRLDAGSKQYGHG